MASLSADLKTRIATLRHKILSYTPGKAVSCDDERVVFPDKLVVGMINPYGFALDIVPALRRALHGDVTPSKHAAKRQTSTEDQEEYLTDSISVIKRKHNVEKDIQDIAGKAGCMVLLVHPLDIEYCLQWIEIVKRNTGRVPLCALLHLGETTKARNELKRLGITDKYEVPGSGSNRSDEGRLQWLDLLRGCLKEGDRTISEKAMSSLVAEMKKKLESKQQHVDTLTEIVEEKERNETTLTQQVEELKKGREDDRAKSEKDKRSLTADMTKKLESKQQHVDSLTEIVQDKERNETTLTQQVKELMTGREEDRAKAEKDIRSIELSWKKEHDSKEQLLEQLEREIWKLRTKIQLESEIRSAEQKNNAETQQWSFIPWVTSRKQPPGGSSSFEDNSTGGLGRSDTLQSGEEPPDDEFAGILQQIADDLYDEAKIDSLAGQMGILQGDIQRALMTNMRFGRVTSDGTRHMLKHWRRGVSREDERIELKKALHAAKLVNLADLYLSEGVEEEQIDAEYASEDFNDQQPSNRDETSLEQDRTKGHTENQVLQVATASSNYTPRDEHTGDTATKTQEELTDGRKSKHLDQSPERSTEDLDESEVTSEEVFSEEVHPGDDMDNVSTCSIQPYEQSPSHEMQVLPEDMSEIAPLVSYGGKPNEETTTLDTSHVGGILSIEEDLISQLVLLDISPEKILLIFLVKIVMDVSQKTFSL